MRVVNIHGPDDVRLDEVPKPELGHQDVLLKIDACGICGSDITFAKYGMQREGGKPWPLGHEAAGTVIAIGDRVTDIGIGQRAVINPMGAYSNIIGNGGSEGAFSDYLVLRDARLGQHLLPISDKLSAARAALVEPLAVALHGVNQAKLSGHEQVVVYGAGPIGLGAVYWLKRRGIRSIVAVNLSEERLARARRLGATDTINPGPDDLKSRLTVIHGEAPAMFGSPTVGTDVFIDMAGAPVLMEQTIAMGKYQSRVVLTAVYPTPVPLDLQSLLIREITLTPAVGYPTELTEVLATLESSSESELAPYVSHHFTFDDFPQAFATAKRATSGKVMVTF